jgi:flagellar biosynthetic protein FliR
MEQITSLDQITVGYIYSLLIVFCRVGAALMTLPIFSAGYIYARARLLMALTISIVLMPLFHSQYPEMPSNPLSLGIIIIQEITIGAFFGLSIKIMVNAMHTAGMIIAYQTGLSSAVTFDPNAGTQGSSIGNFLSLFLLVIIVATNTHHIYLAGIMESYSVISPKNSLPLADMSNKITNVVSDTFAVSFKMAMPHIIIGLLVNLLAGIMARLMPNMQIFFVLMPLQILLGSFILVSIVTIMVTWYLDYHIEAVGTFFGS